MRTDLGHFSKSSDLRGVFIPTVRDFIAVVALFAALAAVAITVNEFRWMDRRAELHARI